MSQSATTASRKLQNRAVLGVCLMIGGLALYPLTDAFVKQLMGTYSVHQTTFLRALTRLIPLFFAVFTQGGIRKVLGTQHPARHAVRLSVNLAYTYAFMFAISMGSLTTVYTLSYTSPLFMILLSALFLKESVGREKWFAVMVGMVGVGIALQPGSSVLELASVLVLFGTFLGALNKILMRRLAETEHSLAIAIYPNIVMVLTTLPFLLKTWQPMPWQDWAFFSLVGLLTATGQYAIAQSLRFAQASTLAPIDYSTFFWVVMLDFFWWGKTVSAATAIGAAVIVASNLYILYCTRRDAARKQAAAQVS